MLPSASSLERASKCLGSAVLPRIDSINEAARRGVAIHAFLARVAEVGRDDALTEVPEEYRLFCSAIDLDVLPTSALEVIAELALAFDTERGVARELGRNIGRRYPPVAASEFVGTADIVTISRSEVFVADFKTGHGCVAAATENAQLRFLGLAAARRFGRQHLRVAIIRIADDGAPYFDSADYDAFELDTIEEDLRDLAKRIEVSRELLSIGEPPPVTTGLHCRWCPSLPYCPAQTMLVRKMVESPDDVAHDLLAKLTPETASNAWAQLKIVEDIIRRVREAVYAFARENPIPLRNGMLLGEVQTQRRSVDGRTAFEVLERVHGRAVAETAVEVEASQASIERALRVVAEETGAKLAKLKRDAMRELEAAGAISVRTSRSVREHKPPEADADRAAA